METIISAAIGGVVTLIVCLINNHFTHKKTLDTYKMQTQEAEAKQQQTIAIIEYKLDELTREVRDLLTIFFLWEYHFSCEGLPSSVRGEWYGSEEIIGVRQGRCVRKGTALPEAKRKDNKPD